MSTTTHNHELHMQMLMNLSSTASLLSTTTIDPHANHHQHHHFHHNHDPIANNTQQLSASTTKTPLIVDHSQHIGHESSPSHHSSMLMYMHGGFGFDYIVFYEWCPKTVGALVASCFALIFISMFYEALKSFRSIIKNKKIPKIGSNSRKISENIKVESNTNKSSFDLNDINKEINSNEAIAKAYFNKMFSFDHLIQTFLHVFQFAISYFIMLSFMTYNYWYCLSILFGIGLGYFMFGVKIPNSKRDSTVSTASSLSISSQNCQECH